MNYTVNHLKIFLLLVAVHSFFVALGLIFIPAEYFIEFGYNPITENFFRAQGGVFHLVMVAAYLIAMQDPYTNKVMVKFSIIAKTIAVVFLFSYFVFVERNLVILLSGVGDLIMALIILFLSYKIKLFDGRK